MFSILLAIMSCASTCVHASLDPTEMQQRLAAGAPILGTFTDSSSEMSDWMASLADDTPIEMINLPGTHDTCAWNYTGLLPDSINTQSQPIFNQLFAGIRFLDIRFGINNGEVMLYHGDALLSDSAQLEDVLWGLYHFLDAHPTETIVASLKIDHGDVNDATLQSTLYAQFTTEPTSDYWVQSETLGTLGAARHKIIPFRRYSFLPGVSPLGINVSLNWQDNNGDFVIDYAPATHKSAFVEDLYQINGDNEPPATKIPVKFDALTAHIENARADANKTQLFVSFASGYGSGIGDTITPKVLAVGDPTNNVTGINAMISPWLQQRKGSRFGAVLFDFYDSEPGLVAAAIGMSVTATTSTTSSATGASSRASTQSAQSTGQSGLGVSVSATPTVYFVGLMLLMCCIL